MDSKIRCVLEYRTESRQVRQIMFISPPGIRCVFFFLRFFDA